MDNSQIEAYSSVPMEQPDLLTRDFRDYSFTELCLFAILAVLVFSLFVDLFRNGFKGGKL